MKVQVCRPQKDGNYLVVFDGYHEQLNETQKIAKVCGCDQHKKLRRVLSI